MNYFECEKNGLKVWVTEQNLNYHQSFNNNSVVSRKTYRLKDINGIELFYNKKDMGTAMTCLVFAGIFFLLMMIGFISQIPAIGLIFFVLFSINFIIFIVTFKKQENSTLKLLIMGIEKEIFIQIGSINSEMLLDAILKAQEALSKNNSQPPLLPKIPPKTK